MSAAPAPPEGVWVDGQPAQAVSALDRGLHYGDGLFETLACIDGQARLIDLHLSRLKHGALRLGIEAPEALLREELTRLAAQCPRAVVKLILTRGAARSRGYRPSGTELPGRVLVRYPWPTDDPVLNAAGVRVRLATLRLGENPALAGLKHLNRLEQVLARREWQDPQIFEALMFSSSAALVSGTMSNVFLVRAGRVCTPRLDRCGVAGVMRRAVCTLAAQAGQPIEECRLEAHDLEAATEVFLTNALIGIRPVREIEGRTLAPGPATRALQGLLEPYLTGARTLPALTHE